MSKPRLVTGLQISFLCIDPDQVDHLKVLRGVLEKFGNFTCPTVQMTWVQKMMKVSVVTKYLNFAVPGTWEVGVDGRHMLPRINPDWSSLWWAGPPTPSSGWVTKSPPDLAQPAEQNGTSLWEAHTSLPHNNSSKTWATKKRPDEEAWITKSQCLPNTYHHLLPSMHFKCFKNMHF